MSRRANPTIIGLFIIVGLALGVGAILFFSSSKWFAQTKEYVLYFDASLTGLDPGTPVKFRGVTIGAVKEVLIHFNQAPTDSSLPVIIELNQTLLKKRSDPAFKHAEAERFQGYIARGLRAKLDTQSLLTGLLYVNLEFYSNSPAIYHQVTRIYDEIPTVGTDMQIFRVDFAAITQKLNTILAKLDTSLGEIEAKEINRRLIEVLTSMNSVMRSPELTNTLISARQSLDEFRLLSKNLNSQVDPLADNANHTLAESRRTLVELKEGIGDLRAVLSPNAPLQRDLTTTLDRLVDASRSIETLAEFLTRHPNALISGRKEAKP